MDAATATLGKSLLRQQILDNENPASDQIGQINPHMAQNQGFQQYAGGQQYSNHDLMTPLPTTGASSSSRNMSITSQSTMNKLFRRNRSNNGLAPNFDDDQGADIQDLTNGTALSFDDITHIRDRGPYGAKTLDTTPIIPTIGQPINSKANSNIEYRKQMNQMKKAAFASGARAMSLTAGTNTFQQQNAYPQGGRLMTMGQGMGPRAMSLRPTGPMYGPGQAGQGFGPQSGQGFGNGPVAPGYGYSRAGSLASGPHPMPHGPNGPMSMGAPHPNGQFMGYQGQGQGHWQYMQGAQPRYPQGPPMNAQFNPNVPNGQFNPNAPNGQFNPNVPNGQFNPKVPNGQFNPNGPNPNVPNPNVPNPNVPNGQYNGQPPAPGHYQANVDNGNFAAAPVNPGQGNHTGSNASLPMAHSMSSQPQLSSISEGENRTSRDLGLDAPENINEDLRYDSPPIPANFSGDTAKPDQNQKKFEKESSDTESVYEGDLSRKLTLKTSNSVRLRKINLFNENEESPLFNVKKDGSRKSVITDDDSPVKRRENREKYKNVGATNSKDVFYTASEFDNKSGLGDDNDSQKDSGWMLRSRSIQLLVANTAFNNFRNRDEKKERQDRVSLKGSIRSSIAEEPEDKKRFLIKLFRRQSKDVTNDAKENEHKRAEFDAAKKEEDERIRQEEEEKQAEAQRLQAEAEEQRLRAEAEQKRLQAEAEEQRLQAEAEEQKSAQVANEREMNTQKDTDYGKEEVQPELRERQLRQVGDRFLRTSSSAKAPSISNSDDTTEMSPTSPSGSSSLTFTKKDLRIMNCNNELLDELELVTTELAMCIKRELSLDLELKSPNTVLQHLQHLSELQAKLNEERRHRIIAEEHVLLHEHNQSPSLLQINYEKDDIYKQLLIKTDMVAQLEDKLAEYQLQNNGNDRDLASKYNDLLKEVTDLKLRVIPELEKKRDEEDDKELLLDYDDEIYGQKQMLLATPDAKDNVFTGDYDITKIRSQRDELRDVVTQLTRKHEYELRAAQDKIRILEKKYEDMREMNAKMSKMEGTGGRGGKLQGFSIVDPTRREF